MNIKNEIKEALIENKRIFELLILLFVFGMLLGWIMADDIASVLMPVLKEALLEGNETSIDAFQIISHNITTAITVVLLSVFFAIFAIISITVNGFVIGFMGGYTVKSINGLAFFLILIVPHGIFEVPALFLSTASGILLFLFIFRVLTDKYHKYSFKEAYERNKKTLKHMAVLFLVSIVLFLIAGLIEGFITPHLGNLLSLHIRGESLF